MSAAIIASKPRNSRSDRGDGTQLLTGERVFVQSCVICHGKNGEGNRDDLIPAIGGQQYGYLLVRLNNFAKQHSDHGPGVSATVAPYLFTPFCTSKPAGTGLGLAMSGTIAGANDGCLVYHPNMPTGACFTLRLPAADAAGQ